MQPVPVVPAVSPVNVATPATAARLFVPVKVQVPEATLKIIVSVLLGVSVTVIVGLNAKLEAVLVGCWENAMEPVMLNVELRIFATLLSVAS